MHGRELHLMVTPVDGVFGFGILVGGTLCLLGYYTYWECDELGVNAFAAFVVLLGFSSGFGGVIGIVGLKGPDDIPLWHQFATLLWALSSLPWVLFAAQYTGRFIQIRRRTVVGLALPYLGLVVVIWMLVSDVGSTALSSIISSAVAVYSLALVLVGVYLLVRTTYTYGQFSAWQGATLALAPTGAFFVLNSIGVLYGESELGAVVLFVGAFLAVALLLGTAVLGQRVFTASPAAGTLGERTVVRETEDLVLIADERDRLLRLNESAVETLDVTRAEAFDTDLPALLGYDTETLTERDTVALETVDGTRQYDPQVSILTRQGRNLGALLSLRDVTDRELREQRLSVLNRVLRHNLRNKVEVLKSHTEVLDAELDEHTDHTATLAETAEDIARLGRNARQIDQFVAEDSGTGTVDVVAAVSETLDDVGADEADITVTVDAPESLPVVTNRRALAAALESAVDNAVTYADSSVTVTVEGGGDGCAVSVTDDGPGIPEGELDWLDSGVETSLQHGTGLGLWQLKWAVRTLGGEFSFETTDGTTVELTIPDRQ
jgi:signal transduction histidine kinase